jgi:hypothetical protein
VSPQVVKNPSLGIVPLASTAGEIKDARD